MVINLTIYNTMSRRKEAFRPMKRGEVGMFVCGPTVQGLMHMGHARTYLFYDVLARYLSHLGNKVKFIVNITDVDERISDAAKEAGVEPMVFASKYTDYFLDDMKKLKVNTVTSYERVSDYLPTAIEQIESLIATNHAYTTQGWVYFDTSTFPKFGRLSHMSKRELSLRPLELSLEKRNLLDFSLWRPEMLVKDEWRSPWGLGSPGWHIQDTAISLSKLGPQYDIHGGAYELVYPHHEAEIAQAESITGKTPLVRFWVHTRLVNTEGEKMSKSVGNVYTVREALKRFNADELRFFFLTKHYRQDIGLEGLEDAAKAYRELRTAARRFGRWSEGNRSGGGRLAELLLPFYSAMNDDLDTPRALRWLGHMMRQNVDSRKPFTAAIQTISDILGFDLLGQS
jgi:cysteinyl-tRNA synthetase